MSSLGNIQENLEDEPIEPIQVCLHCTRGPTINKIDGHKLFTITHECHIVKYTKTGFVGRENATINKWNRVWDDLRALIAKRQSMGIK